MQELGEALAWPVVHAVGAQHVQGLQAQVRFNGAKGLDLGWTGGGRTAVHGSGSRSGPGTAQWGEGPGSGLSVGVQQHVDWRVGAQ